MNIEREFERFNVAHLDTLHWGLENKSSEAIKLVSIGQGGCGFYSYTSDIRWIPPSPVICKIRWKDSSPQNLFIKGQVIYAQPLLNFGTGVIYYGIKFERSDYPLLTPVITRLKKLTASGEVWFA